MTLRPCVLLAIAQDYSHASATLGASGAGGGGFERATPNY